MYLDYFSLEKHPFRITPDPSLFFPGGSHGHGVVLDALIYGITSGEGILKVVGEVGSGKTMLCRMLEERLPKPVEIVYLANPRLSARDIIYAIAFELRLDVDPSTERLMVMHRLQEYLLNKHSEGGAVVVFIEEAQSMPLDSLEEIRLLSNLETHHHKLMQIILFGQPELDDKLQKKSIRQLRERITHSFHLEPLPLDSGRDYLRHRLQAAGCPWPQLFSPKAERILVKAAQGLSRRINILADKSMLAAYADPASRPEPRNSAGEIQPMVLPRHVKAAIRDSGYGTPWRDWLRYAGLGLAGAALIVSMFAVARWLFDDRPVEVLESSTEERQDNAVPDPLPVEEEPGMAVTRQAEAPEAVWRPATMATAVADGSEDSPAETGSAPQEVRQVTVEGGDLAGQRTLASADWLQALPQMSGYTVQLLSVPVANVAVLEEFLLFLQSSALLESTYLCVISGPDGQPANTLVLNGEFTGVTAARSFISNLPQPAREHSPYVRNLNGIACRQDTQR